jgi:hypothetical protein
MVAPFDEWAALKSKRRTDLADDVAAAIDAARDPAAVPTESESGRLAVSIDPFRRSLPITLERLAAAWLAEIVSAVRPGPRPTDPLAALLRTAVVPWRKQMRKYLRSEARASGLDDFDENLRNAAMIAHGARRLAATARKALKK